MQYPLCRHIKTTGRQCGAPALTGKLHCYFHDRLYQRHSGFQHNPCALPPGQQIKLLPLEDRESVQVAISIVVNALATGQLETRRATAILYGLSLASANTHKLQVPLAPQVVRSVDHSPEGLDLATSGRVFDDHQPVVPPPQTSPAAAVPNDPASDADAPTLSPREHQLWLRAAKLCAS